MWQAEKQKWGVAKLFEGAKSLNFRVASILNGYVIRSNEINKFRISKYSNYRESNKKKVYSVVSDT